LPTPNSQPLPPSYPASRVSDTTDVLHGVPIPDPYRWLEDGNSDEVRAWTDAQNALTASWLEKSPARAAIRTRLESLLTIGALGTPTPVKGRYFYQLREGSQNQPVLYVRDGLNGADRVLIDPNALDAAGTTALDWLFPSEDGALLAYGLSQNGSEESELRVLDVATGKDLPDRISRTRAASVAWLPDGTGFYYTRYPAPGSIPAGEEAYHRSVYFHRLGTDADADALIYRPRVKEYWPGVDLSADGRWLVLQVARTFDATDLYLLDRQRGGEFVAVAEGLPATFEGQVVDGRLYLRTNHEAPNYRLYLVDPAQLDRAHWREIVPARPEAVLDGVMVLGKHLALSYLEKATSRLRLSDREGRSVSELALPGLGSVFGWGGEPDGSELLYGFSSFTVPPSIYRVDLPAGSTSLWRRVEAPGIRPDDYVTEQVTYRSKDGTPISMFLVHRRDVTPDGKRPTYLTGYGGFNISMTPAFSRSMLLWLERGGVMAMPNLRGGGEYGEEWHQGGMLAKKQNSFDDFIGAAEWLIGSGWTSPERLAVAGGSNGGLLMGAVLTQRPELFRAVVIQVPLLDMLRYHQFLIARLWIPEYGSAEDPQQFGWLKAYSPYHHVRPGTRYPAVLLATAESDTRVDPMHARKMAARLQAATASDHPILLRLESRAGHGAGKPIVKVLEELTDSWSFVFAELGVE
ncbi:MAG TPA: prolyl oligopeptidase family serine peptidase, partial [Gemmatimonadales bacterium]|nr:prolyl oligopeptidase family serine peptidase [Gemmatimonadales bacterium]